MICISLLSPPHLSHTPNFPTPQILPLPQSSNAPNFLQFPNFPHPPNFPIFTDQTLDSPLETRGDDFPGVGRSALFYFLFFSFFILLPSHISENAPIIQNET